MSHASPQFHQLPMFMTAHEIQMNVTPGDYFSHMDRDQASMWDRKLNESNDTASPTNNRLRLDYNGDWRSGNDDDSKTLTESIAKHGVNHPVEVLHERDGESYLIEGHHRVAAAASISPDYLIPVLHHSEDDR